MLLYTCEVMLIITLKNDRGIIKNILHRGRT